MKLLIEMPKIVVSLVQRRRLRRVSLRLYCERSMLGVWESRNQQNKIYPTLRFLFIKIDRIPQL